MRCRWLCFGTASGISDVRGEGIMVKFFYSDTDDSGGFIPRGDPDPHDAYLRHAENWFILKTVYAKGGIMEKFQATTELVICERKMDYWYRKTNFDPQKIEKRLKEMSTQWGLEFGTGQFDSRQRNWIRQAGKKK